MKKTISLLFFFLIGLKLIAQMASVAPKFDAEKGVIKGLVKENANKTAVEYANIKVYSLPDSVMVTGTITTSDGKFEIKDLPMGKYYLVAEFIGFKKITLPNLEISKEAKIVDCGEIILEPSATEIGEVTVTAEKNLVQYQIDKKIVNIDKKLTAVGGNLVDALENTPSVQVDAEGNVLLRGSSNFTVLIDGKPTALSGNDALKQIPASAVANVEVITNPSAKFDPDGSAGILNIIMKKEYKKGMNGILNASVGSHFQYNGDFNINFRREKVNIFVGGSYADRRRQPKTEIVNIETSHDTIVTFIQNANRKQNNTPYSLKAGLDIYLTPNTTLTLSGDYGFWGFNMSSPGLSVQTSTINPENIYFIDNSNYEVGGHYINSNVSLEQKFNDKGHKILLNGTYSNWDGETISGTETDTTDNLWENIYTRDKFRSIQNNLKNEYRTKIDYTYPISEKTTIEAGYQGRFKNIESDYRKENYLFTSDLWNKDAQYDRGMDFTQNIQSLYFTLSGNVIGIGAKVGLRTEYTTRILTVDENGDRYSLNLFDFIPTVHLSKKFGEKRELQLSYSRRMNHPEEWNLYPVESFSATKVRQVGNPDLKPEYVGSYELNFMQNFKIGFASMEAYYKQTNNAFEQKIKDDELTDVRTITTENTDKNYSYGVEFSGNFNLAKWFSVYASANLYSYTVQGGDDLAGLETQSINSDFVLNTNFMNKKGTRLQISGFYNAPKVTTQGKQSEMYGINTALRQELMKKRLVATLRVNDVFNTMKFKFNSKYGNDDLNFTFDMDSPTVMFSLSYTLNNYKKRADDEGSQQSEGGGIL